MHGNPVFSPALLPIGVFPLLFIGMWLLIGAVLSAMSGWPGLAARYPDTGEDALLTLRWQSGTMGAGVGFNGILTLGACRTGLRVAISRWFMPWSRPFLVPWDEIEAQEARILFFAMAKLTFGAVGKLRIYAGVWERLHQAARPGAPSGISAPSNADLATSLLLTWIVLSTVAAAFFYVMPRLVAPGLSAGPPLVICVGFPVVLFGLSSLIAYLQLRGPDGR